VLFTEAAEEETIDPFLRPLCLHGTLFSCQVKEMPQKEQEQEQRRKSEPKHSGTWNHFGKLFMQFLKN
jgi:hypothetical protein